MKKAIAILLALITLCLSLNACIRADASNLVSDVKPNSVTPLDDLSAGSAAVTDFSLRLFRQAMEEGENTLISPLSVLYALSMTANGAAGETRTQMESVLGLDTDTLNQWLYTYQRQLSQDKNATLSLANSVWFRDDPSFSILPEFLQTSADYYGADIYQAAFDAATCREINGWVKKNTDGMIPQILDRIPEDAVMYLVNALAFDAKWEDAYKASWVYSGTFTTESGEARTVDMMHSNEYAYLEDENAIGLIKYYKGKSYAFAALLPNEGISVADYISTLTGAHLQELLKKPEDITVYTTIPKFEASYDVEMSQILTEMGMVDAFDYRVADFSRMGSCTENNLCISRVLHKTFLSVTEKGTKAAAATAVEMNAEGAAYVEEHKTVTLNRPFVYLLIDCENHIPIFIGTLMDVNGG